ncbi:hypothetical protein Ddc_21316 [Ditylenchus destructor]|nr:hypothetical protein Ddc_21316 [Ditylenchus destructor]
MKIFSLLFLTFLLVALLEVSLGFPFYGHHRGTGNSINSYGNNREHGHAQAQNHGDVNGNGISPTGLTPSDLSGSPSSETPPPTPTGTSTLIPQ